MGMEAKEGVGLIVNMFLKDSGKVLEVSSGHNKLSDKGNVKMWAFESISKDDSKALNGDDWTVECGEGIEGDSDDKEKRELKQEYDNGDCNGTLKLTEIWRFGLILFWGDGHLQ